MHWTQTPEGKKRLSVQARTSWNSGKRKNRIGSVVGDMQRKFDALVKRPVGRPPKHPSAQSVITSKAMRKYWAAKKAYQASVTRKKVPVFVDRGSTIIDAALKLVHDVVDASVERELTSQEKLTIKNAINLIDGIIQ